MEINTHHNYDALYALRHICNQYVFANLHSFDKIGDIYNKHVRVENIEFETQVEMSGVN
jgi:hypothetical protein